MKKTLLSLSILFSVAASAQLTQANQAPSAGLMYSLFQCDTTGVVAGPASAASSWSYTSINTTTAAVANYTTLAAASASYPSADISVSASSSDIAYYKSSGTDLKYYGGDISFGAVNGTVNYSTPAVYATYPMTFNSSITSMPSGSVTVFGSTGSIGGTVTALADGTGTLNLQAPGAAIGVSFKAFNDVVRVKTSENLQGMVTVFGSAITFTITRLNYDYYSPSASKAALLSISNNTVVLNSVSGPTTNIAKSVTVQKNYNVVGINESQKPSIELSVFPNPATNYINFTTVSTEAAKVIALDVTGKIVATELMEIGKAKMNLTHLSAGMYFYHVVDKNNQVLTTGKFNVTK